MGENKPPRTPMRHDEYVAFLELAALLGCTENLTASLEKRLRSIPGGWRDARLLDNLAGRLLTRLCDTIPAKKLTALRREIDHTQVFIRTRPDYGANSNDDVTYVREDALDKIVNRLIGFECKLCDRSLAEQKRCRLRKEIEDIYHFELPVPAGGECPMIGASLMRIREDD